MSIYEMTYYDYKRMKYENIIKNTWQMQIMCYNSINE